MFNFITNYWRIIVILISFTGISITITKLIANSYAIRKISQNEIKHIQSDIKELKEEDKEFKKEIKDELHSITLGMSRVERKLTKREAIDKTKHEAIDKDILRLDKELSILKKR